MRLGSIGLRAAAEPESIALVDDIRSLDWSELAAEVETTAAAFEDLVDSPERRIGVLGENRVETMIAHVAGILTGIGTVALSRQLTDTELIDQLTDARAAGVVSGPSSAAAATGAATALDIPVIVHGIEPTGSQQPWPASVSTRSAAGEHASDRAPHPPLVYTSGTTGRARGTEVRWLPRTFATAADYADALSAKQSFPEGPHLVVGPLQHNGPLTSLRHLVSGRPVIVGGKFDPEHVLELIQRHRVTSSVMVPTHFRRLLDLPPETRERYDMSSLVSVAHTGSACPPDVKRSMIEWWGPVLTESYGGSEIGTVCRINSTEWLEHPGSVGRAIPPFEAVVLDEDGTALPAGEVGVLGFRTPPEYDVEFHEDPEKTAKAHLAPGVATLGDVGYVDDDGFVYVTDRISDMVISGGVNLYPAEIERVLQQHPDVAEVAVIGVPHPDLGESLLALVVPSGDTETDETELISFMKESLAGYKVPRAFRQITELPRNAMGKVDKRSLRNRHTEEMTAR
ncbi:AMP-binding protein [Gordonia mangrovi]|uniref:AMP-binding protein n=1 Tax=Gordonia mangrovi TaxID=2665643 RepID=UPI0021ABBE9C|nr:AMP-binding protein [Gordonia mangrovi]UVF79383.1 AMP-binding protein [Gordonia mangrovi]